jgi:hypothetical protein
MFKLASPEMRQLTSADCPYCPGPAYSWSMGADSWDEFKRQHDAGHIEAQYCVHGYWDAEGVCHATFGGPHVSPVIKR